LQHSFRVRIGYGRVSTRDQHPEAQHDALEAAGCDAVFVDKASGKLARRPELDRALLSANRSGDQLIITKLDRLGRSLEHLIELSKLLEHRGVDLIVLDQGIDTSTAVGRMFFHILGAIAEFEHALMSERTKDGLAAARAAAAARIRRARRLEDSSFPLIPCVRAVASAMTHPGESTSAELVCNRVRPPRHCLSLRSMLSRTAIAAAETTLKRTSR
jgi:DNA invertase Pin-like site-specific DNA recombinase